MHLHRALERHSHSHCAALERRANLVTCANNNTAPHAATFSFSLLRAIIIVTAHYSHRRPTAAPPPWCSPWYVFASHSRLSRRSETSASASSHGSRVTWVHRGRLCNFRRLESERRRVAGVEFYAYSSGKLSALRRRPALGLGRRRGAVLLVGSLTHSLTSLWRWDNIVHCRVSE